MLGEGASSGAFFPSTLAGAFSLGAFFPSTFASGSTFDAKLEWIMFEYQVEPMSSINVRQGFRLTLIHLASREFALYSD